MVKNLDITNAVLNLRKFIKMVKTINLMTDKDDMDKTNTNDAKAEAEGNVFKKSHINSKQQCYMLYDDRNSTHRTQNG